MSDGFTLEVLGADAVNAYLGSLSARVHTRLRRGVQASAIEVQRHVKESKLTGQVLKSRTGRLRRSITVKMDVSPAEIVGKVGTNVIYGRYWEIGFRGSQQVRAHTRKIKPGKMRVEINGKMRTRKLKRTTQVRAHSRFVDQPSRSFLRSSLDELRERVKKRLSAAVVGLK